ncbi:MAG: DEAD/DEAH box helicase [Bacillaceae bacterium]|nr:DEAD/DEAH box helicase [Bacillaceae bacterium]
MNSFSDFNISKNILDAIHDMGFEEPSPIQKSSIPLILEGKDLIGQAQTGTGKTAAFGIPIVENVEAKNRIQAIVLTPTRELAIQVSGEIRRIARHKKIRTLPIYGGQSISHQIRALKQGVQVVIGTPGRMLDHLKRKTLKLDDVKMLVLDEADEMLDMGFIDDIEQIIRHTNRDRQTLLFSATMPPPIRRLASKYMNKPEEVAINRTRVAAPSVDQVYYKVFERTKLDSLCRILDSEDIQLGIVFCRTKRGVDELTDALQERGYLADGLHGDLTQSQRDKVMKAFRDASIELLVATDVAARGIDVSNVSHVINYDIPQDPESYVHRIGRTGRAGRKGIAMTLVTPRELKQLRTIEKVSRTKLEARNLPSFEEVAERQQAAWKQQLIQQLERDEDHREIFYEIVRELSEEYPTDRVAAAALQLAFGQTHHVEEEVYDFGETGASKGMVRFFMNVGKNVNIEPRKLVQDISELAGIPARSIGRIDVFDRFTFLEVPRDAAPFVYEALRQSKINGARVNLEPAKPRNKR